MILAIKCQRLLGANVPDIAIAPLEDIFGVFDHMESVLDQIDFLTPKSSRILIYRIKRMILKTKLETEEVNILRGIFKAVLRKLPVNPI